MAKESTTQSDSVNDADFENKIERQIQGIMASRNRILIQQRLLESAKFKEVLDDIRMSVEKRFAGNGYTPADLIAEQQTEFTTNPGRWAPSVFDEVAQETNAIDMRDIWVALFTPPHQTSISPEAAAKKAESLDPSIVNFLKQERMFENRFGPKEEGDLYTRTKAWRANDGKSAFDKEGALKVGKYTFMAGVLVGTGGTAAVGMLAAYSAKKLAPMATALGVKAATKIEGWLVEKNLFTQEEAAEGRKKLNAFTQKISGSKWGTAASVLALCAVASTSVYLVADTDAFEKITNLFTDTNPGFDVGPDATAEVAEVPPSVDALAHPNGGVFKDALEAKISAFDPAMGEKVAAALANSPEQLSITELKQAVSSINPALGGFSDSALIDLAGKIGLDSTDLRAALDVPINDVTPPDSTTVDAASVENLEALANGPLPDVSNADFQPPTAEALANIPSVTVSVIPGDSLSEIIFETYEKNGIPIGASELYAPSELTDHPKGLVGHIAEINGLTNPDMIMPGDVHEITLLGSEVGINSPVLTEQALQAARAVVEPMNAAEHIASTNPAQISEEAILASNILNAEAAETTEVSETVPLWKGGAMGAAIIGGMAAVSKWFSFRDKEEPSAPKLLEDRSKGEIIDGSVQKPKLLPRQQDYLPAEPLALGVDGNKPGSESEYAAELLNREAKQTMPVDKEPAKEVAGMDLDDELPHSTNGLNR